MARRSTPWGIAQTEIKITEGVYAVTTESHGGILIIHASADAFLSPQAQQVGAIWQEYLAFEEDCAVAAPLYEHPEWWKQYNEGTSLSHEEIQAFVKARLQREYPEYFEGENTTK